MQTRRCRRSRRGCRATSSCRRWGRSTSGRRRWGRSTSRCRRWSRGMSCRRCWCRRERSRSRSSRSSSRGSSSSRRRCWRDTTAHGSLDCNSGGRSCLEEADSSVGTLRRLIGVKPEVIQCAEANRVGVLILCKRFAVPHQVTVVLSDSPRRAAVTLVIKGAVVCPARFLRRRVKSDVTNSELTVGEIVKHVTLPGCA